MKTSVVVTVYNLERYIEATLECALRQAAGNEIIVVDDASSDASAAILAKFASRVTIVRNDVNLGVLRSTVAGLRRATGDIVCFLDGDDIWKDEKVTRVAQLFEHDPSLAMVSHDYSFIDGEGTLLLKDDPSQRVLRRLAAKGNRGDVTEAMRGSILEYRGHVWLGSAYAIRRDAFDLAEFERWISSLGRPDLVYQDHPLATFLVLTASGGLSYIDEKLLLYRVHAANYSAGIANLARARALARKGWETRAATRDLILKYAPSRQQAVAIQSAALREFDFLNAIYGGNMGEALRGYAACTRDRWSLKQAAKEALRFGAIAALGPDRFFALKSQVPRAR